MTKHLPLVLVAVAGCGASDHHPLHVTSGPPRVRIDAGELEGVAAAGIVAFTGIPYASPPLGAARWRPPGPVAPWTGVRAAHELGPMCPQRDTTARNRRVAVALGNDPDRVPPPGPASEDCLFLNVWTANLGAAKRQPVVVYIHGGGYAAGRGDDEPSSLAGRGVVVVSFNYRLGLLGFLAHPALTTESPHHASGNYGVLDQIAALHWVQRNIGAFGGDPSAVTVIGHSAGGGAVLQLMSSPLARGLVHRGIAHSSTLNMSRPLADAEADGLAIATRLGAPSADPLAVLRALPAERLVAALPAGTEGTTDGWVLPIAVPDALRRGELDRVPLIIGATADEADIFGFPPIDRDGYEKQVRTEDGARADRVLARYPADGDAMRALRRYVTDRDFVCPSRYAAAHHKQAWLFRYSLGPAFHSAELPILFGTRGGPRNEAAVRAAERMRTYWVQFALTGDPNQPGMPVWPTYREGPARYLEIGDQVRITDAFDRPGCEVFDEAWEH